MKWHVKRFETERNGVAMSADIGIRKRFARIAMAEPHGEISCVTEKFFHRSRYSRSFGLPESDVGELLEVLRRIGDRRRIIGAVLRGGGGRDAVALALRFADLPPLRKMMKA